MGSAGTNKQHIFKYLRRPSDSSEDMTVDGSTTTQSFRVTAVQGGKTTIERLNFKIVDGGITLIKFGGITALSTGLRVFIADENDDLILDFLDGETIKDNGDFNLLAGIDVSANVEAGDDTLLIRWTIARSGRPAVLNPGDYIEIQVRDDLSNLTQFKAMAQGIFETPTQ